MREYSSIVLDHMIMQNTKQRGAFSKSALNRSLKQRAIQKQMTGKGIMSWIKSGYKAISRFISGTRKRFSPKVRSFLQKHGENQILILRVSRKPVFPIIEKISSVLSNGVYDENKKRLGYDKMFHLFLGMQLDVPDNNKNINVKIEKNHVIEIVPVNLNDPAVETININVPAGLTLNKLLEGGQKIVSVDAFFNYEAFSTNCQHFTRTLLKGSNLLTAEIEDFVMQSATEVLQDLPSLKKLYNFVTGIASRGDHAIFGGLLEFPKIKPALPKSKAKPTSSKTGVAKKNRYLRKIV